MTWLEPELEDGAEDELRPELLVPDPVLALELRPAALLVLAAALDEVPDAPLALDPPDLTEAWEVLELA